MAAADVNPLITGTGMKSTRNPAKLGGGGGGGGRQCNTYVWTTTS